MPILPDEAKNFLIVYFIRTGQTMHSGLLYVLTDSRRFPHYQWPDRVEKILAGGADIIQLREKNLTPEQLYPLAGALLEICRAHDALFIINDHVSLASKINADGVHIGQHDQTLRHAREYLGSQFLIGVSCYRNLHRAVLAQRQTADYVAFGSIFQSTTKGQAPRCSLSALAKARRHLKIPVCAIGGINNKNIRYAVKHGADLVAVADAVFNADDPKQAANNIRQQAIIRH